MILGENGEKMSKSRGNVINPDVIVLEYGADTLRVYEMFLGPLEKTKPWSMNGVKGVYNFISKAYRFFANTENHTLEKENEDTLKLLHKTIQKVTSDIEEFKFNTAISAMMIFTNHCTKKKAVTKNTAEKLAQILSPFAPHVGEEIWNVCGNKKSLTDEDWPIFDESLIKDDSITMAIQINGKTRGTLEVSVNISKEDFLDQAKALQSLQKYLDGKSIIKEIYIPGKICNLVVK